MDIEKLHEKIEKSKKLLEKSCDERTDAIRQFVGKHYGNNAASKVVPTNLLEMAVTIYLRLLAAKAPRCDVKTENPSLEPFANDVEIVVNQIPGEIGLAETIEEVVREAMFSLGVVKVGIAEASDDPKRGDEPFVSLVQLDDYFVDMSAKSWREIQYEGNEYWMDVDTINAVYGVNLTADDYAGDSDSGVKQANAITSGEARQPLYGRILLRDVYLVRDNVMLTYAVKSKTEIRRVPWDGPEGTPYVKLWFSDVPGNLLPLPPVADWEYLHELANFLFRKLAKQGESKTDGKGSDPSKARNTYGFYDPYDREGERPSDSDIIEWTKKGSALIGSENAMADSVHRVRVMILEEGDTEDGDDEKFEKFKFREAVKKTGLYARAFVDPALAYSGEEKDSAREYYPQPTLVADGVVGFRCRTIKEPPSKTNDKSRKKGGYDKDSDAVQDTYEDKGFPYAVELTLFMEKRDDEFFSQKEKSTVVRVVKIPVYEHSQGGSKGGTK